MIDFKIPEIYFHTIKLPLESSLRSTLEEKWLKEDQSNFGQKRIESYIAGRHCADVALNKIEHPLDELSINIHGAPIWPDNFCGSISHTKTLAIACVSKKYKSIGIDVEEMISVDRVDKLSHIYINQPESLFLELDKTFYGTLIFSAKEALFKLINPLCHEYFGFSHADLISCDLEKQTFSIELKSKNINISPFNQLYTGHYELEGSNIVTILWI